MGSKAVGIDLGTTYSCVAVCQNGKLQTCLNDVGRNITPSYVCLVGRDRLVGDSAKERSITDVESTIYDAKRLIGRVYDDPNYKEDIDHWPFDVVEENGRLKIKTIVNGQAKTYYPEEISGMILSRMKLFAEKFLGEVVNSAVITVPAYFNDAQRQATKIAGSLAGLKVLRIVNEPTAAAFAYGMTKNDNKDRNILVFDLGGGTFDVSVLKIFNSNIRVLAVGGNNHLGGEDFDNRLVDYCVADFKRTTGIDLKENREDNAKRALRRLRNHCEKAKITLSTAQEAMIDLSVLFNNKDFRITIARARFESLNFDLFAKTMEQVEICLNDAKLQKDKIFDVVLVGGSTRIPKIQKLLSEIFPNKVLNMSLNPDEAVAHGAAILADAITMSLAKQINDDSLVDVTPLSLGVESRDGMMSVILERNTPIPTSKTKEYSTTIDNQESMLISVYEGERKMVEDNNLLGEFEIGNIPKGPKGQIKIAVTFTIDANSILIVSAIEKSSNKEEIITIVNETNKLQEEEINRLLKEAEENKIEDELRRDRVVAKNDLISYCETMKRQLKNKKFRNNLSQTQKNDLSNKYDDTLEQIEMNTFSLDELKTMKEDLQEEFRNMTI